MNTPQPRPRSAVLVSAVLLLMTAALPAAVARPLRGLVLAPLRATPDRLRRHAAEGGTSAVLMVDETTVGDVSGAIRRCRAAGLEVDYWVEVARSPRLADEHPEWMASLQGHPEWRRLHKSAPIPAEGEVIKTYPWVPVLNREPFAAQRDRVRGLLARIPAARRVFLNDLQAAPSACGCGNLLCRWTTDYGPIRTATDYGPGAAAAFTAAIAEAARHSTVVPVWAPECEAEEQPKGRHCDGVACFPGQCWNTWSSQLTPVAGRSTTIGVLAMYRALQRDDRIYGGEAGWVAKAVRSFAEIPPQRGGQPVAAQRLVAILQGWGVTDAQRQAQMDQAAASGVRGWLMAETPIDQSWEPRLLRPRPGPKQGPVKELPLAMDHSSDLRHVHHP